MSAFFDETLTQMGFWMTWLLIPIVFEIIPVCYYFVQLIRASLHPTTLKDPIKLPMISVILPVFNSEKTLFKCIQSVNDSTYSNKLIQVIVANNQSDDESFRVFSQAQKAFPTLRMQWMNTSQGKARALNSAIYNSSGQYVINLDSDGFLEPRALMQMVLKFENSPQIDAMTGVILTDKEILKQHKKLSLRLLQDNEYFEYAQAFLSGRSVESAANRLFTMSGAFSAFRKDVLLRTFLYNTQTVGEDADMTFQVRDRLKGRVELCPDAFFYVDPIESWDKLYVQRQRWQRGEIEVSHSFVRTRLRLANFFSNFMVRRLMIDHTFIFPRMIWMFGIFVLAYFGYSLSILSLSVLLMYLLYVFNSLLNFINVHLFLRAFREERAFYDSKWWVMFTLPIYNLVCSFIRLIGIINSMQSSSRWQTKSFAAENREIKTVLRHDAENIKRKGEK